MSDLPLGSSDAIRSLLLFEKQAAFIHALFCNTEKFKNSYFLFLHRSCPVDESVEIMDAKSPFIRLQIPSISFQGATSPGILVRCKIRTCMTNSGSTKKCTPRCGGDIKKLLSVGEQDNFNNDINNDVKKRSRRRRRAESFFVEDEEQVV